MLRYLSIAVAMLLVLTGCGGGATVPTMKVGECAGALSSETIDKIPFVPCDQPHDWEAFAVTTVPDAAEYPGEDTMADQAHEFCVAEFDKFVGIPLDDSTLEVQYLFPTTDSWKLKDRTILCLAGNDEAGITGSLKDAQR